MLTILCRHATHLVMFKISIGSDPKNPTQRVSTHEGVVGRRKSQWTTDFSQNSGTDVVYISHLTCSNYSFSKVRVTPTSHFFVFHWLQFTSMCSLFPFDYLPKPTSMGGRICHHSPSSTTSIGQGHIPIIPLLISSSAGWSFQQYPLIHNACGTWWHSCNHFVDIIFGRMKLSTTSVVTQHLQGLVIFRIFNYIRFIHTCTSRWYITVLLM